MKKIFFTIALITAISVTFAQDLKPKKDKSTKKYGFVNKSDEWVVPATYDDADKFKEGYAKIYTDKKEGLINEKGNVVIAPQFDDIEKFKSGIAVVKDSKKYGFINTEGKILCEPKYESISDFTNDGFAKTELKNSYGIIKNDGTVIFEPRFNLIESLSGSLIHVKDNGYWGVVDKTGKIIFETKYSNKLMFNNKGLSVANLSGKFGLAKNDGTFIIEPSQLGIFAEANIYIVNKSNAKWVVSDENGKEISKEFEQFMPSFSNSKSYYINKGVIAAKDNNKWGFIDVDGKTIVPFTYETIGADGFAFSYDLCPVKVGEKWGFIDVKGNYLKEPMFSEVERFKSIAVKIVANVKMEGKSFLLYNDGKLEENQAVVNNSSQNNASANTTSNNNTTTNTTNNNANPSNINNNTQNVNNNTVSPTQNNTNDWIIGTWVVTEEKMGGKVSSGNKVKYVSYTFQNNGKGSYVERYDIMANKTQTKNCSWTMEGNKVKVDNLSYTLNPSVDKKSMTMSGILGSSWKLTKK